MEKRFSASCSARANATIKVKTAYYSVQNVVSVFNGALDRVKDDALAVSGTAKALTRFAFRDRKTGLGVIALWGGTEKPLAAWLEQFKGKVF